MKNIINNTIIGFCCLGLTLITSCSSFESEPYERIPEEDIINPADSMGTYMRGLFNATYQQMPNLHNDFQDSYLDASTDDGVPTKDKGGDGSLNHYRNGSLSPANIASLDGKTWKRNYEGIRRVNLFRYHMKDYPTSTVGIGEAEKKAMLAEARAVRAYYYFELVKRWGGVPIIYDEVLDMDSDLNIARSSMEECLEYIYNEISPDVPTSCYNDLYSLRTTDPLVLVGTVGRFNQESILGLLSRISLYLASPLYNSSNDRAKWQAAADAAEKVIETGAFELYKSAKIEDSFLDFFSNGEVFSKNKEMMIVKETTSLNTTIETKNSPAGYYDATNKCYGYTSPSQNLVDAFLTIDGYSITDNNSNYDPQNPYENRDPRLKHTIFYNGSQWLRRSVETFEGGKDRANRQGFFYTQTGYYLRKFASKNENSTGLATLRHHHYIMRYAEILLNYAEALCEVDYSANKSKIDDCIIKLRERAGINSGADNRYGLATNYTQQDMRDLIRNERRIELAYEGHRFWDIRRWKIAETVMNKPVRGTVITKQADGSFVYNYVDVRPSTFNVSKMYWYPIPRAQMQSNSELKQNPGWGY